jgi:hypothetical protein
MGISSSAMSESASRSGCLSRETGCFSDAAVDGFRSCRGDGWRLMDAPCSVDAISLGMFDSIVSQCRDVVNGGEARGRCASRVNARSWQLTSAGLPIAM